MRGLLAGRAADRDELGRLLGIRADLVNRVLQARRQRSRVIEASARTLTELTGDRVRVSVRPLADGSALLEFFAEHVLGKKPSVEQARRVEALSPKDLVQAISVGKSELTRLGLTPGMADKVLALAPDLVRRMETVEVLDRVVVEVDTSNGPAPLWIDVNQVSPGQAATAMLALALVSGSEPVLIDQPEDDLDNRYIYDEVVQLVARVSAGRQVIVATHNANIPILGDAELVIALEAVGGQGRVLVAGGIDDVEVPDVARQILEGGEQAFDARASRYGALARRAPA